MYEMLGLYEDALVQYDELDALFTQFVLNFAVGGKYCFFYYYRLLGGIYDCLVVSGLDD